MTQIRALTVQQPWAWAIIHGGKTIENRTQLWAYRGPLAIHAGKTWSERGGFSPLVNDAREDATARREFHAEAWSARSEIIGVVDVVDIHTACGCCAPWGESGISYTEPGERRGRQVTHLVLQNPRPLPETIQCRGQLGLWTPAPDVVEQLQAVTNA